MKLCNSSCTHCGADLSVAAGNSSPIALRRALRANGAIVQRDRGAAKPNVFCSPECRRKHGLKLQIQAAAKEAEMEGED